VHLELFDFDEAMRLGAEGDETCPHNPMFRFPTQRVGQGFDINGYFMTRAGLARNEIAHLNSASLIVSCWGGVR
jgi:hypothetical protein